MFRGPPDVLLGEPFVRNLELEDLTRLVIFHFHRGERRHINQRVAGLQGNMRLLQHAGRDPVVASVDLYRNGAGKNIAVDRYAEVQLVLLLFAVGCRRRRQGIIGRGAGRYRRHRQQPPGRRPFQISHF